MSNTYQFNLPLVQPSQAQKHVTVNEALARLDAMAQMRLFSIDTPTPPLNPEDGEAYAVPVGASGDWIAFENKIAIWSNGGWISLQPKSGWVAWVEDADQPYIYKLGAWHPVLTHMSLSGASTDVSIIEDTHTITAGSSNLTSVLIPSHSIVSGVTARVSQTIITDGATSWKIGVSGASGQYGNSYGLVQNSYAIGLTGQSQAYYTGTQLLIEPETGSFVSGEIKFAVHLIRLSPPTNI